LRQGFPEYGPALKGVSAFAGLDLDMLGEDGEALSSGKAGNSLALRFQAKS